MTAGPARLRMAAGAGTALVVGASAWLVAGEPKPAAAPLRPRVALAATAPSTAPLTIPASCGQVSLGGRSASTGVISGTSPASLSMAAQQALGELASATSKAAQRQILGGLSASDRQAVTAYLRSRAGSGGGGAGCPSPTAGAAAGSEISPSVGTGGPITPVVNTYVS
jgi:hypothetical protein